MKLKKLIKSYKDSYNTCKCSYACYANHFQRNFENWTSGNSDIDKFIQDTQLSSHNDVSNVLEWISYDRFWDIRDITKGWYRANWIDGNIIDWDNENQNWKRDQYINVILKELCYSEVIQFEFMDKNSKVYGITYEPITKNYMIVLDNKCKECNYICYSRHFQQNFENWTSGNNDIDKFIQGTQLSCHYDASKALEWIPYDRLNKIEYIAKGGFGKVYRAKWIDGNIIDWNDNQNWKRTGPKFVALKSLDNSNNITFEFMNEIALHNKVDDSLFIIRLYGVTQDPETGNYMMVLEYAEDGSLRNYLDTSYNKLNLKSKIKYLYNIVTGLENIHGNEIIHRDLHIGNILKNHEIILITDMGLCKPADYNTSECTKNNIYGVLPYIAPEILRGQSYTRAADIYSFGIIIYEVISGLPPYHDLSHDNNLAMKICLGLRPRFNIEVPQLIVHLIKRCLDANSLNRPTAIEIRDKLWEFLNDTSQNQVYEKMDNNLPISSNKCLANLLYETHPEAIYTSRLLNFNNLPEPKNSDDYYEQNDDIISKKFSDSLIYNFLNENVKMKVKENV
ncbi:hypothetical protein RclHR1_17330003 [Rhizophagus clarus]|uniref:Protein kinase domain-containing protein n=1 Tax=Rhizophagus clarus TaxID=94130 RepID=A0A2Z6QYN1_9GLOM|nr:hypothetical protein RclHR1_17330003 [Rhizophagus clarus]